jgi:Mannosyl-glycoprotein endo-beta-N-acetylglucosaminidase
MGAPDFVPAGEEWIVWSPVGLRSLPVGSWCSTRLVARQSAAASLAALTPTSRLLAPARVDFAHAWRYFRRPPHGAYTDADIDYIVRHYLDACRPVGLDPLVCFAQLQVETGHLTSFWAARPRCNPAGIGVTGELNPDGTPKGISFGRWGWDSEAVGGGSIRAHVGRLLLYAIRVGHGTPAQNVLMNEAKRWRAYPDDRRGKVTTVGGLAGTWAADPQYGNKLVAASRAIVTA